MHHSKPKNKSTDEKRLPTKHVLKSTIEAKDKEEHFRIVKELDKDNHKIDKAKATKSILKMSKKQTSFNDSD